jgi:hypothetical protein
MVMNKQPFIDLDSLIAGYEAGKRAGEADSQIGAVFRSAWGAARELGFYDDRLSRKGFTLGYLESFGNGVLTDSEGRVINPNA